MNDLLSKSSPGHAIYPRDLSWGQTCPQPQADTDVFTILPSHVILHTLLVLSLSGLRARTKGSFRSSPADESLADYLSLSADSS